MQLTSADKKCISIFRTFIEKAFIPQLKQTSGSLAQWNILQSLLSAPNISINELQLFVDSLAYHGAVKIDKTAAIKKQPQLEPTTKQITNMNKTFGGQKFRANYAGHQQQHASHLRRQSVRDQHSRIQKPQNSSGILIGLQKLIKNLQENQKTFDNLIPQSQFTLHKQSRPALNQLPFNIPAASTTTQIAYNNQNTGFQSNYSMPINIMTNQSVGSKFRAAY